MDENRNEYAEQEPVAPVRKRRKKKPLIVQILHRASPRILLAAAGVLLVLIVLIVLLCKGCSAAPDSTIQAKAFGSEDTLGMALSAELNPGDFVSYGGYQFETTKKLAAMTKLITKDNEGVTAAEYSNAYGGCTVFTRAGEGGEENWCLYQKDPANTNDWYIFMGMHREVSLESGKMDILLPLHLISDSYLRDNMGARIEIGTQYVCGLDKMDADQTLAGLFRAFYEASGLYNVSDSEGGFTIVPKGKSAEELIFTFDEADGSGKFTVSVPVDETAEPSAAVDVTYNLAQEPVTTPLVAEDAAALSAVLLNANFEDGELALEPAFTAEMDGQSYGIDPVWKDGTWAVTIVNGEQYADLNALNSCTVVAVLTNSHVNPDWMQPIESPWPEGVNTEPMAACMVSTAAVNVRDNPASTGEFMGNVITTVNEGSPVAVVAKLSNGWYEINYNGKEGFMHGDYLGTAAIPQE